LDYSSACLRDLQALSNITCSLFGRLQRFTIILPRKANLISRQIFAKMLLKRDSPPTRLNRFSGTLASSLAL
jgi:hypothetical protein